MYRCSRVLFVTAMLLVCAAPAFADLKLNGYYRLQAYSAEVRSGASPDAGGYPSSSTDEKGDSRQLIDQRLRLMLTNNFNDNVSLVYFAEVDTVWGETVGKPAANPASTGTGLGNGGRVGSDGINVETKNVYLNLKSGDTTGRLGIQTLTDAYQGIVYNDDMAGALVTTKIGGTTLSGAYSKWDEDSDRSDWDDLDFWIADVKHKFNDNFTAGASVYFYDDNDSNNADTQETEIFFYGLNGDAKFGNFGLNGFVVLQDGKIDNKSGGDVDTSALAASIKGTMKLVGGDIGLRVIYFSEDDDDQDQKNWRTPQGRLDLQGENLMQMLGDKFDCNYGKERYAMDDAAEVGFGLLGFVLSGNHKLPADIYLNWGAGYFMAIDDERNDPTGVTTSNLNDYREDTDLGYEIALRIGKKFFEKVDVSLNASYAGYGDFYDKTVNTVAVADGLGNVISVSGDDPDGTYKTYLMISVPF